MLLPIALLAMVPHIPAPAALVPMRWSSSDPKTLELLQNTPVNCLLVEKSDWNQQFASTAADRGIAVLGVIRPKDDAIAEAQEIAGKKLTGAVLEGDFEEATATRVRKMLADSRLLEVELPSRSHMQLASDAPILGTYQGVWPGIEVDTGGTTKSAPSGAPWINTNAGFLRFVRAVTDASIWIGNTPPPKLVITPERYMQVAADAAINGAKWIIAFDPEFSRRLMAGNAEAVRDWKKIAANISFYEQHPDWRSTKPAGDLALVQDADSGALMSGGILDMIAVKHTPVRPVPTRRLSDDRMHDSKMAVNVDPSGLTPQQKEVLTRFTRSGGRLLNAPNGWKFTPPAAGQITLNDADVKTLDQIWKEMNTMIGHDNLGVRLFNVSSMLSNLQRTPDGKQTVLELVNFSDFPVESVTIHMLGKYKTAQLYAPGQPMKQLSLYDIDEGSGIDLDKVAVSATLVLE